VGLGVGLGVGEGVGVGVAVGEGFGVAVGVGVPFVRFTTYRITLVPTEMLVPLLGSTLETIFACFVGSMPADRMVKGIFLLFRIASAALSVLPTRFAGTVTV